MKKKPRKIGKKKVVALAREIFRLRRGPDAVCERCGAGRSEAQLQCAHIIPEEVDWLSFDFENFLLLCASCHKWGKRSMHKHPLLFAEWFHKTYPGRYESLRTKLREISKTVERTGIEKPQWPELYIHLHEVRKAAKEMKKCTPKQ